MQRRSEADIQAGAALARLDLDNCAREPIHIPGSIQSHGVLLALSEPELCIRQLSANAGTSYLPGAVPGARLDELLPPDILEQLRVHLQAEALNSVNPIKLELPAGPCNVIAHRVQDLLVLELEPIPRVDPALAFQVHRAVNATLEALVAASSLAGLWEATVRSVQALTGYRRVMIYRFDGDWNGEVVAEARDPAQEPFLGLHYPASDIPAQARELYLRNWLRIIPDVNYAPIPLLAAEAEGQALDLSAAVLRSVSPMHLQYLRNMQVAASMSVSLICEGKLWGLIACHHDSPAPLPYERRQGLELIGKVLSSQIYVRERQDDRGYRQRLKETRAQLLAQMQGEKHFLDGLFRHPLTLLSLAEGCSGAAIHFRGRTTRIGAAPAADVIHQLVDWLPGRMASNGLFVTSSLAALWPVAQAWKDSASGILCLAIPEPEPSYVLWFKPEVLRVISWGGNPAKPMEQAGGSTVLGPRRSFAQWRETLRYSSLPWAPAEIEAVEALRQDVIEVDLQRQVAAAMASNAELDHFAQVVAHDLKEPLRGITAFSGFLAEDLAERLDPESRANLGEIRSLAEHGRRLVSELYDYSRLGRVELAVEETDLNHVLGDVLERLAGSLREASAEVVAPRPLPRLRCDRVRVAEVFANLLSNAIQYNDNAIKRIEVGVDESSQPACLYVRDDGIGIPAQEQERVFHLFERLGGASAYGGGSGAGLSIVRRIVERHGGRIWLESAPGRGSTFRFTLSPHLEVPVSPASTQRGRTA